MNALVVFAKFPELGKVKKNLAREIGDENALELYHQMLDMTTNRLKSFDYRSYIAFRPLEKEQEFKRMFPDWFFFPQEGNDLGERLFNMMKSMLAAHEKAILIESDIIGLKKEMINKAFSLLDDYDVVIGPAFDGGYYLIGMKQAFDVFSEINWDKQKVLDETLAKCRERGFRFILLDKMHEVESRVEVNLLRRELEKD